MEDVVVLYNEDSVEWTQFIVDHIGQKKFQLTISAICDSDIDLYSRRTPYSEVKVIVLVVSQGHLDFLQSLCSGRRRRYEDLVQKARSTIVLLLGIEDDVEEEEREYTNTGNQWHNWIPGHVRSFIFTHEQYQEMLLKTLDMVQNSDDDQLTGSTVTTTSGEGNKNRTKVKEKPKVATKEKVNRKQGWKFKVIPTTARVEEPTTMIICLDGGRWQQQQQQPGSIEGDSGDDAAAAAKGENDRRVTLVFGANNEKLVSAERIDRNTFMFQSPEFSAGKVSIKVFVDGDVIGQTSIVYRSFEADVALAIGQVYMFLLNRVLGCVEEHGVLTQELDQLMSDLVDDDEAAAGEDSIPLLAFELLFAMSAAAATDKEEKSVFDLPTLLHLAARYNLHQLGSKLTDLPCSVAASALRSRQNLTACEIARSKGHRRMVELFEALNGNINTMKNKNRMLSRKSEARSYLAVKEIERIPEPRDDKHQTHRVSPKQFHDQTHIDVNDASEPSSYYETLSDSEDEQNQQPITKIFKQKALYFAKLLKSKVQSKSKWSASSSSSIDISDLFQTPLETLELDQSEPSPSPIRNSVASDGSRDSCISKTSYGSGFETNHSEEDERFNSPPLQTLATKKKSSANLEQLEADLRNPDRQRPPPIPPRVPRRPEQKQPHPWIIGTQQDRIQTKTSSARDHQRVFISADARGQNRAGAATPSVAPKPWKMPCSGEASNKQQNPVVEAESNFPAAKKIFPGKSFDQGVVTDINNELESVFNRRRMLTRQSQSWHQ